MSLCGLFNLFGYAVNVDTVIPREAGEMLIHRVIE